MYNFLEPNINLNYFDQFKNKSYCWLLKNPFYSLYEFFNTDDLKCNLLAIS